MADQTTRQCELRKVEANEGGGYETGRDAALWPFAHGCKGLPYSRRVRLGMETGNETLHESEDKTRRRSTHGSRSGGTLSRRVGLSSEKEHEKTYGRRDRARGNRCLPFGEARRRCLYIASGVGRHKLRYESEGEKGRKGVKNVLPATDPRGIVEKGEPVSRMNAEVYCILRRDSGRRVEGKSKTFDVQWLSIKLDVLRLVFPVSPQHPENNQDQVDDGDHLAARNKDGSEINSLFPFASGLKDSDAPGRLPYPLLRIRSYLGAGGHHGRFSLSEARMGKGPRVTSAPIRSHHELMPHQADILPQLYLPVVHVHNTYRPS